MEQLEREVEEASAIVKKIKNKNDILSKMPYDDDKVQQEVNKDKSFL